MNRLYRQFESLRTHHLTFCKIEMMVRGGAVRAVAVTSLSPPRPCRAQLSPRACRSGYSACARRRMHRRVIMPVVHIDQALVAAVLMVCSQKKKRRNSLDQMRLLVDAPNLQGLLRALGKSAVFFMKIFQF
jgi:hypothetical protein